MKKIDDISFFQKDAITLAKELIGKWLVRKLEDGTIIKSQISETEAYMGEDDKASHARFGKTKRNAVMYEDGGTIYVYLIYGIYYLLNVVSNSKDIPQAVLIRATIDYHGPGIVTKNMKIDKQFNNQSVIANESIWIEDDDKEYNYIALKRVNIDYADTYWKDQLWRFKIL